ncbi:hypothetical protein OFEAOIEE_LOCUS603 [Methylorubrum extorquens]
MDLDVEAPGLGSMLLTPETTPPAGLLDYFVEANLGQSPDDMFPNLVAPSWLGAGEGIIDVIPALGSSTEKYPENVLAKIARAYVGSADGQSDGVSFRLRALLEYASSIRRYDVIFIDARAGLHETTGAALLGLGAHVLLFGVSQPQTFAAYNILLANLAIVQPDEWEGLVSVVQAKSRANVESQRDFAEKFRRMLTDRLAAKPVEVAVDLERLRTVFDVEWIDGSEESDKTAEATLTENGEQFSVSHILESEMFRDFDPLTEPDRLASTVYTAVYGSFLNMICRVIGQEAWDSSNG